MKRTQHFPEQTPTKTANTASDLKPEDYTDIEMELYLNGSENDVMHWLEDHSIEKLKNLHDRSNSPVEGPSLYHYAARADFEQLLDKLSQEQFEIDQVNVISNITYRTPLMTAAMLGKGETCTRLMSIPSIELNITNSQDENFLSYLIHYYNYYPQLDSKAKLFQVLSHPNLRLENLYAGETPLLTYILNECDHLDKEIKLELIQHCLEAYALKVGFKPIESDNESTLSDTEYDSIIDALSDTTDNQMFTPYVIQESNRQPVNLIDSRQVDVQSDDDASIQSETDYAKIIDELCDDHGKIQVPNSSCSHLHTSVTPLAIPKEVNHRSTTSLEKYSMFVHPDLIQPHVVEEARPYEGFPPICHPNNSLERDCKNFNLAQTFLSNWTTTSLVNQDHALSQLVDALNAKDIYGRTVLHHAHQQNNVEAITILKSFPFDWDIRDLFNRKPEDLAQETTNCSYDDSTEDDDTASELSTKFSMPTF